MMSIGVQVGLGTDGYTSDMFESGKVANVLQKHAAADPSVAWGEVPQMLYGNNPEIASKLFGGKFGELVEGAWADVIVRGLCATHAAGFQQLEWTSSLWSFWAVR